MVNVHLATGYIFSNSRLKISVARGEYSQTESTTLIFDYAEEFRDWRGEKGLQKVAYRYGVNSKDK